MSHFNTLESGQHMRVRVQEIMLNGSVNARVSCYECQEIVEAKVATPFSQDPHPGDEVILWRTYYSKDSHNPKFLVFHSLHALASMQEYNARFLLEIG